MNIPLQNPTQVFLFCLALLAWTLFTALAAASDADAPKVILVFSVLGIGAVAVVAFFHMIANTL